MNVDYLLTDRIAAFAEWQMDADLSGDRTQHLLSVGAGYQWTDAIQVSFRIGAGLTPDSPDFLAGIRWSLRF